VLEEVIDKRQSTFVGGRNLLHSEAVANEVIDEAKMKEKKCLIFKSGLKKSLTLYVGS